MINTENVYLAHHGVQGQKWGTRRWQNEDGSHTPAGCEHYGCGKNGQTGHVSKAREGVIDRREAEKAARLSSDRARNVLGKVAIGVGIAVGATAIGYCLYKTANSSNADFIIKAGQECWRVAGQDSQLHDVFYMSVLERDRAVYKGLDIPAANKSTRFENILKAQKDIRVAGRDTCAKLYDSLIRSNPDFKVMNDQIVDAQRNYAWALPAHLRGGKVDSYDLFNATQFIQGGTPLGKAFMAELKSQGYAGLIDGNDVLAGNALKPVIFFGNSPAKNDVISKVGGQLVNQAANAGKTNLIIAAEQIAKSAGDNIPMAVVSVLGGSAAVYASSKAVVNKREDSIQKYYDDIDRKAEQRRQKKEAEKLQKEKES